MSAKRLLSGIPHLSASAAVACAALLVPATGAGAAPEAPEAHAAAKLRACKDGRGSGRLIRHLLIAGVTCTQAQALARRVVAKAPTGCYEDVGRGRLSKSCRVSGYRCTYRPLVGGRVLDVTCKRGTARVIAFQY
jgi:hypothetical protein